MAFALYRLKNMNALLKRKSVQIALCVFSVVFGACSIYGFVGLVRQTHTRALEREFAAAVERLQKSPPGVERAQTFVQTLKAIDSGYSPVEVKLALRDYVAAFQKSLDALKVGRDATQYDQAIAEARQRLISCVKKYD
jgi:hypothetical protein